MLSTLFSSKFSEPFSLIRRILLVYDLSPSCFLLQLNTAQALAAAAKAGELSDAVINEQMNSEDATLASQEGLAIRFVVLVISLLFLPLLLTQKYLFFFVFSEEMMRDIC